MKYNLPVPAGIGPDGLSVVNLRRISLCLEPFGVKQIEVTDFTSCYRRGLRHEKGPSLTDPVRDLSKLRQGILNERALGGHETSLSRVSTSPQARLVHGPVSKVSPGSPRSFEDRFSLGDPLNTQSVKYSGHD